VLREAITTVPVDARAERYRQAEHALWRRYGLEPTERFIDLDTPAARLRVLEIGSGQPILFVHGTVGPAAWAPLARELSGFRCLILERPGWGLSGPVDYSIRPYKDLVAELLTGTLDALGVGVGRVHVVGGSIGTVWALRLAERQPSRVERIVLLGGAPVLPEVRVPRIIRLLSSPIGALMARLPERPAVARSQLRQNGHGASLDAGRIADEYLAWREALSRDTRSMRRERDMIGALVNRRGWRAGLTFDALELSGIPQPTSYLYGTADPVATADILRRFVTMLPRAELHVIDGAGHSPWLDDPVTVGAEVGRFLRQ
jgi:pimeloyl-ACP methyl ester carboxylesterase